MRPSDIPIRNDLREKLISFHNIIPLPGIQSEETLNCFISQIVDSIRRIEYVVVIKERIHSSSVIDTTSLAFDPLKAAAWHIQNGNTEEAAWLVFLASHFGKNKTTKWQLVKNIYGGLNQTTQWNWVNITRDVSAFRLWVNENEDQIKLNAKFGNHRKYECINGYQKNGCGETIATYIDWVLEWGSHANLFRSIVSSNNGDKRKSFSAIYKSLNVARLGRTGKFDYLTMIGKLGLAAIEPDSTYMVGATGPYEGAKLLFGLNRSRSEFNEWLEALEAHLDLYFGMQVIEDSLCNWQKNPQNYIYFAG